MSEVSTAPCLGSASNPPAPTSTVLFNDRRVQNSTSKVAFCAPNQGRGGWWFQRIWQGDSLPFFSRTRRCKIYKLPISTKLLCGKGKLTIPHSFSPHKKSLYWEHIANSIQVDVSDEIECSVKYNLTQDVICTNWSHTSACLCNFWVLSSLLIVKLE